MSHRIAKDNIINQIKKDFSTEFKSFLFKFDIFSIYMRHTLQPSSIIKMKNKKKALYIQAGDAVFHSHYITGAGLNRTINFAVKCANFITNLIN